MSREILFRGKRIDNGEWVEGFYVKHGSRHWIYTGEMQYMYLPVCADLPTKYEVSAESVCQYTGLTDKNGRKIFEGDVVRDIFNASVVGIVRYGDYRNTFNDDEHGGHVGFYIEWKKKWDLLRKDLVYWVKNSEFIGNIFDNPELLNQ